MKGIVRILAGAVCVWILLTIFYTVHVTEYAVVLRFGDPVRTVTEPGLYAKLPWPLDRAAKFDRRLLTFDIPRAQEPPRELLTLDKKNIEVSVYTAWRVIDPLRFLETVGDRQGAEAYLSDIVISELGKLLGRHNLSNLISTEPDDLRMAGIASAVRDVCGESARRECGVEIVDFRVKRINLPEQNRESVFERMRAERKQIATRYRSEGEQQAASIRSEADRERMEILAQANRQALEIEGDGEAEAARIYNEAYGRDREFYEFLRTLASYEKTLDERTTIILPRDMDYLRLLANPGRGGRTGN